MRNLILTLFFIIIIQHARAQSLVGKWQLVKQTDCMEENISSTESEDLVTDMKSRSGPSAQIVQFKDNKSGSESTRVLSRKKNYNAKSFLYKFNGDNLLILDKKSQTIIESYSVEKFDGDSLVISNASRACETKVFIKIK